MHVGIPEVTNCEVIFNAKRGFNFNHIARHYVLGLIACAVLENPTKSIKVNHSHAGVKNDQKLNTNPTRKTIAPLDHPTRQRLKDGHPFLSEAFSNRPSTPNASVRGPLKRIWESLIGAPIPTNSSHNTPEMNHQNTPSLSPHKNQMKTANATNNNLKLTTDELMTWLAQPRIQAATDELKKMESFVTLRVTVDFPCRETFYVESMDEFEEDYDDNDGSRGMHKSKQRDMEDGHSYHINSLDDRKKIKEDVRMKLIQGHRERSNNVHSLLLESTFDIKSLSISGKVSLRVYMYSLSLSLK